MTDKEIKELISKYMEIARETDADTSSYSSELSGAQGVLQALLAIAYEVIPETSHLKEWIPTYIQERADEIGQKAVMRKLES